jgi:hypothetical protein
VWLLRGASLPFFHTQQEAELSGRESCGLFPAQRPHTPTYRAAGLL